MTDDDKPNGKRNVTAKVGGLAAAAGFSPPRKKLGDVVKALRFAYGISRDELETAAGLPFGTVQRIEQGKLWPSWVTLDKLCAHPSMQTLIETCVSEGVELGVRPPKAGT